MTGEIQEYVQTTYYAIEIVAVISGVVGIYIRSLVKRISDTRREAFKTRDDLATFKLQVAEKYVSTNALTEWKKEMIDAINRLGDRLDGLFTNKH